MKVTLILCDFIQVADGKLNILGGGWTLKGPISPMGVGVLVEVPWSLSNDRHAFVIELLNEDGSPALVPGPTGYEPLRLEGAFEVGRPPGHPHGAPLTFPLGFNVPPVPLPPKQRFEWRLTIDGKTNPEWSASFTTAEPPPAVV